MCISFAALVHETVFLTYGLTSILEILSPLWPIGFHEERKQKIIPLGVSDMQLQRNQNEGANNRNKGHETHGLGSGSGLSAFFLICHQKVGINTDHE